MKTSISKKIGVLLTLATMTVSTVTLPNRANAAVGFATFNPIIGFLGLTVSVVGASIGIAGLVTQNSRLGWGGFVTFLIGVILLDEEKGTLSFQSMTPDAANRLGVTPVENQAYNQELNKINLINQTVTEILSQDAEPTVEKAAGL